MGLFPVEVVVELLTPQRRIRKPEFDR